MAFWCFAGDTGDFQGMAEIMAQSPLIQLAKQAEEKGYVRMLKFYSC